MNDRMSLDKIVNDARASTLVWRPKTVRAYIPWAEYSEGPASRIGVRFGPSFGAKLDVSANLKFTAPTSPHPVYSELNDFGWSPGVADSVNVCSASKLRPEKSHKFTSGRRGVQTIRLLRSGPSAAVSSSPYFGTAGNFGLHWRGLLA